MWDKPTGESDELQKQLDHFVDDLDHLNELPGDHAGEAVSSELDDNDMSWLDVEQESIDRESTLPMDDYATDLFEGESSPPERPFKFLFGLFAGSTVSVLALLWFFWPNTDMPLLPSQMTQDEQRENAPVVADESFAESQKQATTVLSATEQTATAESVAATLPVVTTAPDQIAAAVMAEQKAEHQDSSHHAAAATTTVPEQKQLLAVNVNLGLFRDAPGTHGKVIARLKRGTVVLSLYRQGDWYRIRFPDGRKVWAHSDILAATKNSSAAEEVAAPALSPSQAAEAPAAALQAKAAPNKLAAKVKDTAQAPVVLSSDDTGVPVEKRQVLTIGVNLGVIRDAPGRHGRVVARLKAGTPVMTLFRQGEWYQVLLPDGRRVWAHQSIF